VKGNVNPFEVMMQEGVVKIYIMGNKYFVFQQL